LKRRCERLAPQASDKQKRVRAWLDQDFPMPVLMRAADLLISKLGNAFDEAIAAELPLSR
jgi:UDP-N-acetylglucosamine:LPS N-acetylglucosamine transferase